MALSCIIVCSFILRAITGTDTALEKTPKLQWNYVPEEKKKKRNQWPELPCAWFNHQQQGEKMVQR